MNKIKKLSISVLVCASCIGIGTLVANGAELLSAQAGDSSDPLVTKSYVDQQISNALGSGSTTGSSSSTGSTESESTGSSSASTEMVIITIDPGQQLIAESGTEVIIRAGKAVIYSGDGSGVSDLTEGTDLMNGATAPSNHLLLIPRDGRGITAVDATKNVVTVMVRGGYSIRNIDTTSDGSAQ